MKKALVSWIVCGVLAATGAVAAGPEGRPGFPPPPPDPVLGPARFALMGLDLASDQRTRIQEILDEAHRGSLGELARSFEDARRAVEIGVWDPASSADTADDSMRQLELAAHRLLDARRILARDLLSVLDAEQRRTFLERIHQPPPRRPA